MPWYRIADKRYPIFDGTGAKLTGGRWNSPGRAVIYAAETFAGATLEVLVHINLAKMPRNYAYIEISVPHDVSIETVSPEDVPGWDDPDQAASRAIGDRWLADARSTVLLVPSLLTGGVERNVLINPVHSAFWRISATEANAVPWDSRLFKHR